MLELHIQANEQVQLLQEQLLVVLSRSFPVVVIPFYALLQFQEDKTVLATPELSSRDSK